MGCKFSVICKFYQQENKPCNPPDIRFEGGLSEEEIKELMRKLESTPGRIVEVPFSPPKDTGKATSKEKRHYIRKNVVKGSIKDKPSATVRHCKKCDFVSTGQSEGASKAEIMAHYKKEHPKAKVSGKRTYKRRGGQLTTGMGFDAQKERLERENKGLKINKDSDVKHAWNILQARSNDSTLSRESQKSFDKLEDETADLSGVTEWPFGIRGRVVSLYNEVVNGVLEEVKT